MQRSSPFSRATQMMHMIAAIMAMPIASQQMELAKLGTYTSRGKGKGVPGKVYRISRNKFTGNGPREVARRQRQIAKGMLSPVHAV